jgi:hypothetical protein
MKAKDKILFVTAEITRKEGEYYKAFVTNKDSKSHAKQIGRLVMGGLSDALFFDEKYKLKVVQMKNGVYKVVGIMSTQEYNSPVIEEPKGFFDKLKESFSFKMEYSEIY